MYLYKKIYKNETYCYAKLTPMTICHTHDERYMCNECNQQITYPDDYYHCYADGLLLRPSWYDYILYKKPKAVFVPIVALMSMAANDVTISYKNLVKIRQYIRDTHHSLWYTDQSKKVTWMYPPDEAMEKININLHRRKLVCRVNAS